LAKQTQLSSVELDNLGTTRTNKDLTQELLLLAEETRAWKKEDISDTRAREQVEQLERDVAVKRARWRIVKSVVAGMIVGCGIDWASDPDLVSLVLEDDDPATD
jgi:Centromere protein H (CENP-H)